MNKQEYAAYEESVADFFAREGLTNLSTIGENSETYFSWQPCECCNRHYGGDRQECNGYIPETNEIGGPYSVCSDCVYYAEYGRLDDMTMDEIESDTADSKWPDPIEGINYFPE